MTIITEPEITTPAEPERKQPLRRNTGSGKPSKLKLTPKPGPKRVSNGERLAEMAARPEGFTIEEVCETFDILRHTARALISIELRRKRGLRVIAQGGRYRLVG